MSVFVSDYPELNALPITMDQWLDRIGSTYDLAMSMPNVSFLWEEPLEDDRILAKLDRVAAAHDAGKERWYVQPFQRPDVFETGSTAFSIIQIYVGENPELALEYQLIRKIGEQQYILKNFYFDFELEQLDFVKSLFLYAKAHNAMPPLAVEWNAMSEPIFP